MSGVRAREFRHRNHHGSGWSGVGGECYLRDNLQRPARPRKRSSGNSSHGRNKHLHGDFRDRLCEYQLRLLGDDEWRSNIPDTGMGTDIRNTYDCFNDGSCGGDDRVRLSLRTVTRIDPH